MMNFRRISRGIFHIWSFFINKLFYYNNYKAYKDINNILIFRPDNLGDFIMSVPAINSIKKKFPQSKITCVVNPDSKLIADKICDNTVAYISPFVHSKGLEQKINLFYIIHTLKEIGKTKKYDLIIDLRSDILTLLYATFYRSRFRIDASSYRIDSVFRKTLNTLFNKNTAKSKITHEMDFIKDVLEKNKIKIINTFNIMSILSQEEMHNLNNLIPKDIKDYCVLHPGASWEYRMWNYKNFAKISDFLIENFKLNIVILGSKGEKNIANKLYDEIKNKKYVTDLTGKTSIVDTINICGMAKLAICNDSAIGHIAAMTGINTISLFGAQDPELFAPRGKNVWVVKKEIKCSPCAQTKCYQPEGQTCMDLINVDDVILIIKKVLGGIEKQDAQL